MSNVIRYHFRQDFAVAARAAFDWCTDYTPQDHALMGYGGAKRQIQSIAESTLLITDTFPAIEGQVEKQKLVELYPDMLLWIATHLSGPNKFSQFQYQIVPDGETQSHLDFTGLVLDYGKELKLAAIEALAGQLCREDANIWQRLAHAMAENLSSKR